MAFKSTIEVRLKSALVDGMLGRDKIRSEI